MPVIWKCPNTPAGALSEGKRTGPGEVSAKPREEGRIAVSAEEGSRTEESPTPGTAGVAISLSSLGIVLENIPGSGSAFMRRDTPFGRWRRR
jgi:hypothetical protein